MIGFGDPDRDMNLEEGGLSKKFLFFWGLLTALVWVMPDAAIMGLYLYIAPGVLLIIAPSVFVYGTLAKIFSVLLPIKGKGFRFLAAAMIFILIGSGLSLALNIPIWMKMRDLHAQDIPLASKVQLPDVLAIYDSRPTPVYQEQGDLICSQLCQKLLYNGAVKKVIMLSGSSKNLFQKERDKTFASYTIEKGTHCPIEGIVKKRGEGEVYKNVAMRLAAGECLVKTPARLTDAQMIFSAQEDSKGSPNRENEFNLLVETVKAKSINLLQKEGEEYKTVYKYSRIEAEPYIFPLTIGPIISGMSSAKFGFLRFEQSLNGKTLFYSYNQDFEQQLQELFGDSFQEPKADLNTNKVFTAKLDESLAEPQEINGLLQIFIHPFYLPPVQKKTLSDEDEATAMKYLADTRATNFWGLGALVRWATPEQRERLVRAITERIINEPMPTSYAGQDMIKALLSSLFWEENNLTLLPGHKNRLESNPERMQFIHNYLTKKIKDDSNKRPYLRALAYIEGLTKSEVEEASQKLMSPYLPSSGK